ncbi:hypothetical protein BH11MYX3_BH11MYX3_32610 [soil metagenome]
MRPVLLLLIVAACKDSAEPPPAPKPDESAPAVIPETMEGWDATARTLDATVAGCARSTPVCRQAARDAVQAHGRALHLEFLSDPRSPNVPVPLPPRTRALVSACDAYARLAEPGDPELPNIEMIAVHERYAYGWLDEAVRGYEEILREHRDSEAATLSVAPLLDALRRTGRAADLRRWVMSLLAATRFLAGRPALRELLEGLRDLPPP